MYAPDPFAVIGPAEINALLASSRLATLVTHGEGGLFASHLPLVHEPGTSRLIGHLARANPHHGLAPDGSDALIVVLGPDAYVSPNWYPSKAIDGRQVPTWNYEAVHVRGRLSWFSDRDRLLDLLARLTHRFEAASPSPWQVSDAPADYIDRMLRGIVGVEVEITEVSAKRKMSQNKADADREGVIAGLEEVGETAVARVMRGLEA